MPDNQSWGGPNNIPAEYFGDIPARVKVIGIIDAAPNPTREKPTNDVQKKGKVIASKIPSIIAVALNM